jgi:trimeric autotransporter adhesin
MNRLTLLPLVPISRGLALVLGLGVCLVLADCGGGGSSNSGGGGNPPATPTISSISPTSVIAGAGPATLTVNGTNFLSTSTVEVNGQSETTTFVSATQLTAAIPAAQLTSCGNLAVVVLNGSLSSGLGTPVNFVVNNPSVGVLILSPSVLPIGGTSPVTVSVTGNTFVPASVVNMNGSPRPTTYVNSTTLTFGATVADQAAQATLAVTVTNPAPGGGTSPIATLSIGVPQPVVLSVSPSTFFVGSPDSPITVSGTYFASNSVVNWNGSALPTSLNFDYGGSQLNAMVPAADFASAGTAELTVSTAGVTTSNPVQLSITNPPVPTVSSISPVAGPIGAPVQVTLTGTGFTLNSTVEINGTNIAATVVSPTEMTVNVPASGVSLPGNLNFTVTTPAPGGGTSVPVLFTAYIGVANNSMVYDPATGLFYVSVPSSAGPPYGNSVVSVDPETGALGAPIAVGSEPDQLAISSDGTVLWVGLDGASAVREVNLTTGTAGLQFSMGGNGGVYQNPPNPLALAALPGSPNSVVVATQTPFTYEGTVAIFDSGVLRGTATSSTVNGIFYSLLTNGTRSEIYAGGGTYQTYTYNASGLTPLATGPSGFTYANYGSNEMQIAGGNLYTDNGQAFDAESGNLLGTFYVTGTTPAQGPAFADTTLGLVFILDSSSGTPYGSYNQIQTFDLSNYTSTGKAIPVSIPTSSVSTSGAPGSSGPSHLTRWGTNGLAFRTNLGVVSLRSNLVKNLSNVNADLRVGLTASGGTTTGNNTTYTATVTDNGPSASTNIALTATLPSTGVLVSATPSVGTCSTGSIVSCDLGGLANGAASTVVFVVQETSAGAASMTVQVSGSENDPNMSNNTASASVAVTGSMYNLTPTLSAINPAAIESGSSDTVITVTGAGFGSGATVLLGGTALPTTYSSSTELTATVPQSALTTMGWAPVKVSNPAPGGGISNPVPLSVFTVITLGVNHILYDSYSRKIMASVGSGSSSITGNSIVAITPETATVGTPVPIGSQPTNMALTSDGQTLYTILTGSQSIAVFNMLTQSAEFSYQVQPGTGTDTNPDPRGIATQPGSESTVAIDLGAWAGNAIYSFDFTNKTAAMVGQASGPYSGSCLAFLDAGDMLAFDTDTSGATLDHYTVTSAGFTYYDYSQYTESTLNGFGCFKLSGGLAFANAGGVANPATVPATQLGVFPVTGGGTFSASQSFVPDSSLQSAFYLVFTTANSTYPGAAPDGIQSFNQNTFLPISSVSLNMGQIEGTTSYSGVDVVRWGQDGLAILTSGGHIYFLRGAFVVPGLLGSNSAATLNSSSVSSITHGAGNTLLTLTGSNFRPGVAVTWNGSYRTTTIVDATHLNVAIPATDLATAGTASVVATNPGGPASNRLTITIQ